MADRAERCFVIGLGTGVMVGELAALDETQEIVVAEISQGVIDAAPLFDPGNLSASKSHKASVRRGDAYRTLLASGDRFDVIASEPSMGHRRRDALQRRVPPGGAQPPRTGRRLRAVVPHL